MQDLTYHYDGFSNLDARIDNQRNLQETFTYDHLNRLTGIWLGDTETGRMDYDAYGRMEHKTADGRLVFTNAVYDETTRPHAIDRADTFDDVFSEQSVTYTCFDKVKTITQGNNTLEYTYCYDRQSIFMEEHTDHGDRTKRYVGNCELLTETTPIGTVVRWLTCLVGPTGAFAMVETDDKGNHTLQYILKDNLGSWNVITDKHGNLEQELSFDAWGNLRNPDTWTGGFDGTPMFDRGYTGHEHLYAFGLINMNGRMYDPQMSSFLSVDAYVQSPENVQSFNRYAYCLNNPLRYTDPSGWEAYGLSHNNPFHDNWSKSFVEPVYEWRDICDPAVRSEVASAVLASYMVGNGCSFSGFISIGNDGKIREISVIGRFDIWRELNYPISIKNKNGACVVTALGSAKTYWFAKTGKYGDGTKKWIEKSKEFEAATGCCFNCTPMNVVKFIEWNNEENSYSNYEATLIHLSDVYDALCENQDYVVAICVNLKNKEDIEKNNGQIGHFANVSYVSLSENGSIKLCFLEPNGTSIMKPFEAPNTTDLTVNLKPDYLDEMCFIKYKLIVKPKL